MRVAGGEGYWGEGVGWYSWLGLLGVRGIRGEGYWG